MLCYTVCPKPSSVFWAEDSTPDPDLLIEGFKGLRVPGLGFRVQGLGFKGSWFRV